MKRLHPSFDLAMERSREVKRGACAPRRVRISCPKDPADAEARMDETPLIEKVKKGNFQAFSVSLSANASAWNKKKRNGLQEAQILLERINGAKDSAQGSEMAPSANYANDFAEQLEMALDEDEIPILPNFRPFGKSTLKERAREDEIVMDISNVPRRARSSSSRFSSLRRQQEPCSAGVSPQQAPTASHQSSPSPKLLAKRPVVTKSRLLKDFRMMGSTHISDQEVEVAAVLFDLSRSMSSFVQSTSRTFQAKSCRGLEEEDLDSSSSQVAGNTASESLQKSGCPSDEPKSKRQRGSLKEEETIHMTSPETGGGCFVRPFGVIHSSVMEVNQMDQVRCVANEFLCQQPELMSSEVVTNPCYGDSQLHVVDDKNASYAEPRSKELARAKALENNFNNNNSESRFTQGGPAPPSPSVRKSEMCGQVSGKDGEHSMLLSRSHEDQDAKGISSKVDLTCLPMKVSTEEEGEDGIQADNKRLSLSESSSNFARDCGGKTIFATTENISKGHGVKGASAPDSKDESSSGMRLANKLNQDLSKHTSSPWKEDSNHLRLVVDAKKEKDMMILDLRKDEEAGSVSSPLTVHVSSNKPVTWMGDFPPPGFYGKEAPPWPTNFSNLGTGLDRTTWYPAIQLPHTRAQHSLPRIRRCATHVHVAHYIQQQQRFLQQAYWPPTCHSGAPYNLGTSPANLQGKEQCKDVNIPSLQTGSAHGHTPSQSIGTWMPSSRGSVANLKSGNGMSGSTNSACVLSVGARTGTTFGNEMTLQAHAQYTQTTMQQNGFASLCMPSNGSFGQNASIFNRSFYPAYFSPQNLQSIAQQTSSLLHLPKRQGLHSSPHVSLSHPLSTQPHAQLQQQAHQDQLQHAQLQQQAHQDQLQHQRHYVTTSSKRHGAGSDGCLEGDWGCTTLRQKQSIVSHQQTQFQVQKAASSVHSPQLSSHNSGPRIRPKVRELDPSVSKGIDLLGISSEGRGSVGPVQLELEVSAVAAKVQSGFSGACEIDRVHNQQQQSLGAQKQQYYQQSLPRAPATLNAKRYNNKDHGILEEKQSPIKQVESPADVGSKAMECHLPMNVVSSSCGGPVSIDLSLRKNLDPSSSSAAVSGETLLSPSWQLSHPQNQVQKQAMAHVKFVSGENTATGASVPNCNENVSVRETLGKAPPSPGKTVPSSQQSQAGTVKASHRSGLSIGSSLGHQAWGNLQSSTNWASHNSCASRPSSGTFSLCAFPTSSSLKVDRSSASNDTFSGQHIGPAMQGVVAMEPPTLADPNLTFVLNSREEVATRVLVQPKGQGQRAQTQLSRQQSISSQLGAMHHMYHHPHPPSDKHQQYVHESPSPQQSWPLQAQKPSSQHIQPQIESSAHQQSHLHRELHSLPSNVTLNAGISPSGTLRAALQGNTNNSTSPGGGNNEKESKH